MHFPHHKQRLGRSVKSLERLSELPLDLISPEGERLTLQHELTLVGKMKSGLTVFLGDAGWLALWFP